jgi:DUF971 family protein
VLQTGKREVGIVEVEPVGHYAIKPTFSDGHASASSAWSYLYELWLARRTTTGRSTSRGWSRRASTAMRPWRRASGGSCSHH